MEKGKIGRIFIYVAIALGFIGYTVAIVFLAMDISSKKSEARFKLDKEQYEEKLKDSQRLLEENAELIRLVEKKDSLLAIRITANKEGTNKIKPKYDEERKKILSGDMYDMSKYIVSKFPKSDKGK